MAKSLFEELGGKYERQLFSIRPEYARIFPMERTP